jgi:putative ABC transport system permease protein
LLRLKIQISCSEAFFSQEIVGDSTAVVINEACARLLGYDTHENKRIAAFKDEKWNVIGIVEDFNYADLKKSIQPLVIFLGEYQANMAVRLTPGNVTAKVELVESLWKKYSGGRPFAYSFIDDEFDALFRSEQRLGKVFASFTIVAIFIACLGLLGLATYTTAQRVKEISIRKVLGANIREITVLLLRDLLALVLIAFVLAVPLSWYGMEQWLQSFAYRVNFDVYAAIFAGAGSALIAMLTIGYQSLKAARVSPVEALKRD